MFHIHIHITDLKKRLDAYSDKFSSECKPLLSVHDAYPKLLIARTRHEAYQYEGVRIVDFSEWLMEN